MSLQIHTIVSMPFAENTYVVWQPDRRDALVIDPGLEPDAILDFLKEQALTPAVILNTHGHADHIGGNAALKRAFPQAPLIIGSGDAHMLTDAQANLSAPFGMPITSPPADAVLREGDVLDHAGIRLAVLDVPGHSPGHILFYFSEAPELVFSGDVLFREGIGRSDFPGSDPRALYASIQKMYQQLPRATVVYWGHGPVTTIGHEMDFNPFVSAQRRA